LYGRVRRYYGVRIFAATGDLDVLEIAPRDAGRAMLELGMRGSALHRKYKIYLDHVGVAHVRKTTKIGSRRYFREPSNIFDS
jgi:hypothetical protein